ncbi:MAG: hypothetical protein EHM61_03780 [Acidobacteria bacterium]|nr:MAG: hypothetical protein EHM61_03780 [Acidobacteriota bacterium]
MSSFAVLAFLLSITAFYVFLSIYILVYVISRRTTLSVAKVVSKPRKERLQGAAAVETNSPLW